MIAYPCPACGRSLRVGHEQAGKKARCPSCATITFIPMPDAPASPVMEAVTLPPAAVPTGPARPAHAMNDVETSPPAPAAVEPVAHGTLLTAGGLPITTSHPQSATPDQRAIAIPGYEILGELGRGGMGVVYRARQTKLHRVVALKMILSGAHAGEADLARFRTEAEAIARLQHPNIVQIHEIGEHEGKPFFSLEFCAGGALDRKLGGTPLPPKEAARLVETLARAMFVAHQANVIHRDLKPANVLLLTDGTPKITDFGLAKKLDDTSGQTQSGAIMGTPSYMAPEQAGGKSHEIGPAADVYALGAILYELLTGRPPFKAATPLDTVLQVVSQEPVPVRRLNPPVPTDLETICHKCLQKDPEKRYASAAALADDLARYSRGEPIAARPAGRAERAWRWCRRNPALAGSLAAVVVALLVGGGVAGWQAWEARREAARADLKAEDATREFLRAEGKAELARNETARANEETRKAQDAVKALKIQSTEQRRLLDVMRIKEAVTAFDNNLVEYARDTFGEVAEENRTSAWHFMRRYCEGSDFTFYGHSNPVTSASWSPDGRTLATGSWDTTVRLWDAATGRSLKELKGHDVPVTSLAWRSDGRMLASASYENTVRLWDVATGRSLKELKGHTDSVTSVSWSPDDRILASASKDMTVELWNAATGQRLKTLKGHTGIVTGVSWSPDGRTLASASEDRTVRLWDPATGRNLKELKGQHR